MAAAVLTPSTDPLTQGLLALPLMGARAASNGPAAAPPCGWARLLSALLLASPRRAVLRRGWGALSLRERAGQGTALRFERRVRGRKGEGAGER